MSWTKLIEEIETTDAIFPAQLSDVHAELDQECLDILDNIDAELSANGRSTYDE